MAMAGDLQVAQSAVNLQKVLNDMPSDQGESSEMEYQDEVSVASTVCSAPES